MGVDFLRAMEEAKRGRAEQSATASAPAQGPEQAPVPAPSTAPTSVSVPELASVPAVPASVNPQPVVQEPTVPSVQSVPPAAESVQAVSVPVGPVEKPQDERPKRRRSPSDTIQIPAFPKALIDVIWEEVPGAKNRSDALAAWVYAKSSKKAVVPQHIKTLAANYKGNASVDLLNAILEKLDRIERMAYTAAAGVTDEHYMLEWLMLERMALINSPRLDNIDFTDKTYDQLRAELKQRIQQAKNVQQLRDGRPYR